MNILRRLPLSRLLLLCVVVVAVAIGGAALASALGSGPTPEPKPLAQAIHDALEGGKSVQGLSANVTWTNHLLEGANLASGDGEASQLTSSPLLSGASGRMWISKDGHVRLELQSEKGDTQVYYDGHTVSMYDASNNTLYRYTPTAYEESSAPGQDSGGSDHHEIPSVAKIEEGVSHLNKHASVSGATPTDVAGQAAYTVHVSPRETGSLLAGAELSFDAVHGVPLRAAIYSTESSSPALELAATEISYGPVEQSVFEFTPPANAKVQEIVPPAKQATKPGDSTDSGEHPKLSSQGHGLTTIGVLESKTKSGTSQSTQLPEGLQQVKINGITASELPTELGTLLSFERSGVRYLIAGALTPSAVEALARGL
jgi:outer membrane lipoprotein-sorting protein